MARTLAGLLVALSMLVSAQTASADPLHSLSFQGCFTLASPECGAGRNVAGLGGAIDSRVSPDGRAVYAVSQSGHLLAFDRNPRSGVMSYRQCFSSGNTAGCDPAPGLIVPRKIAVSPDSRDVYSANEGVESILSFHRDPASGQLQRTQCLQVAFGPNQCGAGGIDVVGLRGVRALAVSPDGRFAYAAAFGANTANGGALVTFSRDTSTGTLSAVGCLEDPTGTQGCPPAAGLRNATAVTVSPDGKTVYVAAKDADAVTAFSRNATTGALTPIGSVAPAGLDAPTDVAVSPDGTSVYATAQSSSSVVRFTRNTSTGVITPAGCIQNTGGGTCSATTGGLETPEAVEVSPDGQDVFVVSSGGNGALVQFGRNTATGALTPTACLQGSGACGTQALAVNSPRGLSVAPDGSSVLIASNNSSLIGSFAREVAPVCLPATSGGTTQSVALDCYDPNGTRVTIDPVTGPANGSLGSVDQSTQRVTYTPNAGFSGVDSFTYRATSSGLTGSVATATVVVPGQAAAAGPASPPTVVTVPGPARTVTRPAPLYGVLAGSAFTAKRGRSVRVPFAVTRAATATLTISRKGKTVATLRKTLRAAGRATITWNGRIKRKAAPAGSYRVALVVRSGSERASDRASLKLTR